jgi:hypothetical protein
LPLTLSNHGAISLTFTLADALMSNSGKDVLVVEHDPAMATAMESALTTLGDAFNGVTDAQFQAMTTSQLLTYNAVFYAGTPGYSGAASASETVLMAYLDTGGLLYISDNDLGYYRNGSPFYNTYLQSTYVGDDATKGNDTIVGADIMSGITGDISSDPFPDYFTAGAQAATIFQYSTAGPGNHYPAGVRVARNGYKAIYTAFDLNYLTNATVQQNIIRSIMAYLTPTDLPWLSETPLTGAVAARANQPVAVTFDAAHLTFGTYSGALWITTNGAAESLVAVPVTLSVVPSHPVFLPIVLR